MKADSSDLAHRGFMDVVNDLREDLKELIQEEISLLKTEMSEKAGTAGRNIAKMAAGAIAACTGAMFLLACFCVLVAICLQNVTGLSEGTSIWLSCLIFALLLGGVGYLLIASGQKSLSKVSFKPEKTLVTLKEARGLEPTPAAPAISSHAPASARVKQEVEKTIERVQTETAEVESRLRPAYMLGVLKGAVKRRPYATASVTAGTVGLGLGYLYYRFRRARA